jgi:hypothetical protein
MARVEEEFSRQKLDAKSTASSADIVRFGLKEVRSLPLSLSRSMSGSLSLVAVSLVSVPLSLSLSDVCLCLFVFVCGSASVSVSLPLSPSLLVFLSLSFVCSSALSARLSCSPPPPPSFCSSSSSSSAAQVPRSAAPVHLERGNGPRSTAGQRVADCRHSPRHVGRGAAACALCDVMNLLLSFVVSVHCICHWLMDTQSSVLFAPLIGASGAVCVNGPKMLSPLTCNPAPFPRWGSVDGARGVLEEGERRDETDYQGELSGRPLPQVLLKCGGGPQRR